MVHVAAVAQLVRKERKRLEQIHPKALCPTCLYTHTHIRTLLCVHLLIFRGYRTVFSFWETLISLWETLSAALDDIRHNHD